MADNITRDETVVDDAATTETDGTHRGDAEKGAIGGAIGGAIVGALAGGPVGAIVGAVVGGVASGAGVAAVDHIDHDNSPGDPAAHSGRTSDTITDAPSSPGFTGRTSADLEATPLDNRRSGGMLDTSPAAYGAAGIDADANHDRTLGVNEQTVIPVVEEQLAVGKQAIEQGGARVTTHVIEQPVQEQVQLHEEHVIIDRRPVDRPLADTDMSAFQDRTVEMTETAEVPVVAKNAHVVEEVVIGKTATDRTETVSDTIRRTDIDVENLNNR